MVYRSNRLRSKPATSQGAMISRILPLRQMLRHEVKITVQLCRHNFKVFIFAFTGGLVSRILKEPLSLTDTLTMVSKTLGSQLLCNYVFDIANQIACPEEDRINKPHRPIPAGLMTVNQAKIRLWLAWIVTPIALYFFAGVWAAVHQLHWQGLIFVCYIWPRWSGWFMRNYFTAASYWISARLLNEVLGTGSTASLWDVSFKTDLVTSSWLFLTIHMQEFHDIDGDRQTNRKTLPIVLSSRGVVILRWITSVFTITFATRLLYASFQVKDRHILLAPIALIQEVASCFLAYRIVASDSPGYDMRTYHVYYYGPATMILLIMILISCELIPLSQLKRGY